MSLPNVALAVQQFEQSVTLRKVTTTTDDDANDVRVTVDESILACIQVARPEELLIDNLDRSVRHIKAYARFTFKLSDLGVSNVNYYIIYKGVSYKIIQASDWIDYGYSRCFAEETKLDEDV